MGSAETKDVLVRFYDALCRHDGDTMAGLYAGHARFEDPVFRLQGADIGRMWKSLMARAKGFSATYTITRAEGDLGTVKTTAHYLFGGKRKVVNVILSELRIEKGVIVVQKDVFDFPRWAAQALGMPGRLFGRFGWFQRAVSRKAAAGIGIAPRP